MKSGGGQPKPVFPNVLGGYGTNPNVGVPVSFGSNNNANVPPIQQYNPRSMGKMPTQGDISMESNNNMPNFDNMSAHDKAMFQKWLNEQKNNQANMGNANYPNPGY